MHKNIEISRKKVVMSYKKMWQKCKFFQEFSKSACQIGNFYVLCRCVPSGMMYEYFWKTETAV